MKNFILCYDIGNNNQRNKLAKICEKFGIRVQYSVFEFHLKNSDYIGFEGEFKEGGFLNNEYSILLYPLHDGNKTKIKRFGEVRHWDESFELL